MLELERLGVRVVSGRVGRKLDDGDDTASPGPPIIYPQNHNVAAASNLPTPSTVSKDTNGQPLPQKPNLSPISRLQGQKPTPSHKSAPSQAPQHEHHEAVRRNSSLGISLFTEERRPSMGLSSSSIPMVPPSLFNTGGAGQRDASEAHIPPHRPYTGGGPAAAYEAAFHDHYLRKNEEQVLRRGSGYCLGATDGGQGTPSNGNSTSTNGIAGNLVNPDQ
jgi:hypothetical protein